MRRLFFILPLLSLCGLAKDFDLSQIKVPAGYSIEFFANDVPGARSMSLGPKGIVFVGTRDEGKVYALVDLNGDFKADNQYTIASGLKEPNGVAYKNGTLYVAEISRVLKFENIDDHLKSPPQPAVVFDRLPKETHHGWKFIAFGPDGWLYVPVGAPCNICDSKNKDPRFASILRMRVDKTPVTPEIFAEGVRNTVGFDWHPKTHDLWFTDNGRDLMGDDLPADELNVAPKKGLHFGYPYCHQGNTPDPKFGSQAPCSRFQKPALNLGPHVAALGMRFWNDRILIAEHGSWNRSKPVGYRVMQVTLGSKPSYEIFVEGWLTQSGKVLGRPVDVLPMADGSVLVSDDHAGAIYRIAKKR